MGSNAEGQGSTKNMRHEDSLNDGFECIHIGAFESDCMFGSN